MEAENNPPVYWNRPAPRAYRRTTPERTGKLGGTMTQSFNVPYLRIETTRGNLLVEAESLEEVIKLLAVKAQKTQRISTSWPDCVWGNQVEETFVTVQIDKRLITGNPPSQEKVAQN